MNSSTSNQMAKGFSLNSPRKGSIAITETTSGYPPSLLSHEISQTGCFRSPSNRRKLGLPMEVPALQ
jgi:hypothetical protein